MIIIKERKSTYLVKVYKHMKKFLDIITPTYNRCYTLNDCYNSLCIQTNKDFRWIIIDDGSIDDTKKVIEKFILDDNINILYKRKDNGGKHTALNYSHRYIDSEMVLILDSDDKLVENCVETIFLDWQKYKSNRSISGITYLRGDSTFKGLAKEFPDQEIVDNTINYRAKNRLKGDYCEVIRASCFKEYSFPVFENEKFLTEGCLWNKLSEKYNMVFMNKIIYICEYLEDGLTNGGRKLRITNPMGGMYQSQIQMGRQYPMKVRIKNSITYTVYGFYSNKSFKEYYEESKSKIMILLLLPISFIVFVKWRKDGK